MMAGLSRRACVMLWVLVALVRASGQRPCNQRGPVPDGSMTELIAASRDGDKAAVESQLAAGADLNERDEVYIIYGARGRVRAGGHAKERAFRAAQRWD